jgi:HD domain
MAEDTLDNPLTSRFAEALALACELHRSQARKGTQIPYVSHLLAVASLALEYGATEDEAIAAVLHDAVEDQGGAPTARVIENKFGKRVADIVRACSDTDVVPKPPWRERKEAYIAHVRDASASVRLVSACDKLHNARAILADYREHGESLWERFSGGRDGTLWYYRELIDAFSANGRSRLVDELDRVVTELEVLARTLGRRTSDPSSSKETDVPAEPKTAEEAQKARDAFIADLIADPEKYRREWNARARRDCPWMTEAQLDASWEHVAQLMGL